MQMIVALIERNDYCYKRYHVIRTMMRKMTSSPNESSSGDDIRAGGVNVPPVSSIPFFNVTRNKKENNKPQIINKIKKQETIAIFHNNWKGLYY